MPRFRMLISYNGRDFSGWQRQPNATTVQGTIEAALTHMNGGLPITLAGASRTDAGVHAQGQVAIFDYVGRLTSNAWLRGLNALTPPSILLRSVEVTGDDFHPRFASTGKWYRYALWQDRRIPPHLEQRVWGCHDHLDVEAMQHAAKDLVGVRDFAAFRGSGCEARTTIRAISELTVRPVDDAFLAPLASERGKLLIVDVRGDAFLKYMVRNMVGTLEGIGRGNIASDAIPGILASKDRRRAGLTAPPAGLTLVEVRFDGVRRTRAAPLTPTKEPG